MTSCPYLVEPHATEREWHRARLRGIGASESSAVIGLSRWCGPLGLYLRKLESRVEEDADHAGEMAEAGRRHEATIAEWFGDQRVAGPVTDPGPWTLWRSRERAHVYATLDRVVQGSAGPEPLEIKCAWYDAAREWSDRVPVAYQIQVQHQLYVAGAARGWVACLLNGYQFRWYCVERHQPLIERLMRRLDEFWGRVQRRDAPVAGADTHEAHALRAAHPCDAGHELALADDWTEVARAYDAAYAARRAAEAAETAAANRIKQAMGDARVARLPDGTGFRWANSGKTRAFRRITKEANRGE